MERHKEKKLKKREEKFSFDVHIGAKSVLARPEKSKNKDGKIEKRANVKNAVKTNIFFAVFLSFF